MNTDLNYKWISINFSFSFVIDSLEEYVPLKEWMVKILFVSSDIYTKYPVMQ